MVVAIRAAVTVKELVFSCGYPHLSLLPSSDMWFTCSRAPARTERVGYNPSFCMPCAMTQQRQTEQRVSRH